MAKENPFAILRANPRDVDAAPNSAAFADMHKRVYYALTRLYHSDNNKSERAKEMYAQLTEAWAEIHDEVTYAEAKKRFLKPGGGNKVKGLTAELEAAKEELERMELALQDYCLAIAGGEKKIELSGSHKTMRTLPALKLPRCRLLVLNTLVPRMLIAYREYARPGSSVLKRSREWQGEHPEGNPPGFDVEVAADGTLTKFPLRKLKYVKSRGMAIPKVLRGWVPGFPLDGKNTWAHYWERTGAQEPLTGRVIGALSPTVMHRGALDQQQPEKQPLLLTYAGGSSDKLTKEKFQAVQDGYTWDEFRPLVSYMSPFIAQYDEHSYPLLVVCSRESDDTLLFKVLGPVRTFYVYDVDDPRTMDEIVKQHG